MRSSDLRPTPMQRVALVAPRHGFREVLVDLADAGMMEIDDLDRHGDTRDEAADMTRGAPSGVQPRTMRAAPDVDGLRRREDWDLVAGEAEVIRRRADAVDHGPAEILIGWVPTPEIDDLTARLAQDGASLVPLPRPRTAVTPTRMERSGVGQALRPLVETYAVVPYEDVDPSLFAGITYVLMFGMMFGDVGHGLVLALLGVWLARTSHPRVATIRHLWPFPVAAGAVAAVFGLLYGEAFGPTGLVPTLWLAPLDEPVRLLLVAIGLGAGLLAGSYAIGTVNRWREGGLARALYAPTGFAGVVVFLGAAVVAAGIVQSVPWMTATGATGAGIGLVLTFIGLKVEAGSGGAATAQAAIELFDSIIRIGANVVSFGRLAAFGLTHAAIGFAVWEGTSSLWEPGFGAVGAIVLFVVGNVVAFVLEALVAGVQALRLEYYELFSRVFAGEGRRFEPWHVPLAREDPS